MNLYDLLIIDWLLMERYYFFSFIKNILIISHIIYYINIDFESTNTNLTYSTNTKTNLSISIAYLEERTEETDIKTTDISLHDQMWISVYRV